MSGELVRIITSRDPALRNLSLDAFCRSASRGTLLAECADLELFRRSSPNLYERVRALFFLYSVHRFHLPRKHGMRERSLIPYDGYVFLLQRRFEEALNLFLAVQKRDGPSDGISSALAQTYHQLGFQTLADQVRHSVRSEKGNQWMFRIGHPMDHPLRVRDDLLERKQGGLFPILHEKTPVRMDMSHSAWSDIFFLGMDFPEGARVMNVSIDLAVRGRDAAPCPPVEAYFRVIEEPVLRLASVDLKAAAEITDLAEVFDFARDYLGLLKAAIIAAGIVPPGMEGCGQRLGDLLDRLVGPGRGIEIVSRVNGIPKGSRLAVSTSLLACLIAVCMRATGQAKSLFGTLAEEERRLTAARAVLGEWLGGSGGGWQDSGGVWPGMKLITGVLADEGDPEYGISRGRLLPSHQIFGTDRISAETRRQLQDSLVLVHGGMAQDVGPILEMVTEKYLLRSEAEWRGREKACAILDEVLGLLFVGDVRGIGDATTRNFFGPLQTIIPWATNLYTETIIDCTRKKFQTAFWGFWMLGGMSGGGMGFIFDPTVKAEAQGFLLETMCATKQWLGDALPFAMEPVIYDFAINAHGTRASLLTDDAALMPAGYYTLHLPALLRTNFRDLMPTRRAELDRFGEDCRTRPELAGMVQTLFDRVMPRSDDKNDVGSSLAALLGELGFDHIQHEQIRADLRGGRIGLAQNRHPASTVIADVDQGDVLNLPPADESGRPGPRDTGLRALRDGTVAVVTLAAGVGSRWTQGAGVVKALHPFCKFSGKHRSFLEMHLAKSRRTGTMCGTWLPHIITTSYLTHEPIRAFLAERNDYDYPGELIYSPGRAVGQRLVPMTRDLRFAWEETQTQLLDEQAQKVRDSLQSALIGWAEQMGEGSDYIDNVPLQCLHPVGHWYEIPNLLRNGVLSGLLSRRPQLQSLLIHNIDTLGADVDPLVLGTYIESGKTMMVEVITRRVEDRGGGLARVDGHLQLIEGMALPREKDEFKLSYYNSNTMWIDIDGLLEVFGLVRTDLANPEKVADAVRTIAAQVPTYITLKDVKKRWGHGQEDIYPVAQFERLWGDMTALPGMDCLFLVVPRMRGQQLKEQAQLDGWFRDGSADYVDALCEWS